MKFERNFIKKENGQVIVISVMSMAILLFLSGSLLGYGVTAFKSHLYLVRQQQALELAQAGIAKAISQLNVSSGYFGETDTALGAGTFTTTISVIDASTRRITSTGYIPNRAHPVVTRTVKATAVGGSGSGTINMAYAILGGDSGVYPYGSEVEGDVFSNGPVSAVDGGTYFNGNVTVASTAPALDQQWTATNSDFVFGKLAAQKDVAQKFVPSSSGKLTMVSVNVKKIGNPGNLNVYLTADSSGKPSTSSLASATITSSQLSTSYAFINVVFNSKPNVTSGTKYWLVLNPSGSVSTTNYYSWALDSTNGYAPGVGMSTTKWNQFGVTWNAANGDFGFKTYLGGTQNSLSGINVGGTAKAYSITAGSFACSIGGDAYYMNTETCTVHGQKYPGSVPPSPTAMPVTSDMITAWEAQAQATRVINGDYMMVYQNKTLGPAKINGDFYIFGPATLTLTGPVWVKGNIFLDNATVKVSSTLGNNGAVLIADYPGSPGLGYIQSIFSDVLGNGDPNSFAMEISTSNDSFSAIYVQGYGHSGGGIYYAPNGTVSVNDALSVDQITGKEVDLNYTDVRYASGLQQANFPPTSSGGGTSWHYSPGTYVITQ